MPPSLENHCTRFGSRMKLMCQKPVQIGDLGDLGANFQSFFWLWRPFRLMWRPVETPKQLWWHPWGVMGGKLPKLGGRHGVHLGLNFEAFSLVLRRLMGWV